VGVTSRCNAPHGLGVLPNGDLVVADTGNHAIRVVKMARLPNKAHRK